MQNNNRPAVDDVRSQLPDFRQAAAFGAIRPATQRLLTRKASDAMVPTATLTAHTPLACFSMAITLDVAMPTYSGGLGMRAGETLRSAAHIRPWRYDITGLPLRRFSASVIDLQTARAAVSGLTMAAESVMGRTACRR